MCGESSRPGGEHGSCDVSAAPCSSLLVFLLFPDAFFCAGCSCWNRRLWLLRHRGSPGLSGRTSMSGFQQPMELYLRQHGGAVSNCALTDHTFLSTTNVVANLSNWKGISHLCFQPLCQVYWYGLRYCAGNKCQDTAQSLTWRSSKDYLMRPLVASYSSTIASILKIRKKETERWSNLFKFTLPGHAVRICTHI